ncbi:MAG: hypothetical protein AB1656_16945 [Candidatus Omnitrophota bacterium]
MIDQNAQKDIGIQAASNNRLPGAEESGVRASQLWLVFFSIALFFYLFLSIGSINARYVDYGDGNYLYLSWRMAEGERLYRDIPSPQPPLHLFLGALLVKLGDGDAGIVRLWQAVQHSLTACCVLAIALRAFASLEIACLAGAIYIFLPEGVWWAAGYQSEPLLILLQCFNLLLLLKAFQFERPSPSLYAAAFVSVLCCFTNMTALPYAALQWFFVWLLYRQGFWRYTLALLVPGFLLLSIMLVYSEGQYLEYVFFQQVGTYPMESLKGTLSYFLGKLNQEGGDILFYEGGFVFAALSGLFLYSGDERCVYAKPYILWWAIFSLGSIIFVTKGGTVEYIFTIGEPAAAIFSAYFLANLFLASGFPNRWRELFGDTLAFGKFVLAVCLFLPAVFMKPLTLLNWTFSNAVRPMEIETKQGRVQANRSVIFEIPGDEMEWTAKYIRKMCPEDKTIISPPYYAFLAKRKITENATCLFMMAHAYFNEWARLKKTRNLTLDLPSLSDMNYALHPSIPAYSEESLRHLVAMFDQDASLRREYPVIAKFLELRRQIMSKKVALILKNSNHFYFLVPPLDEAIRNSCRIADEQPIISFNGDQPPALLPREERITAYVPK